MHKMQINFIEEVERVTEEERRYKNKTEMYKKWLNLPEKTLIREGTKEREELSAILWETYCELYQKAYHECLTLPDDEYIWMNPTSKDYWVLNKKDETGGEHIETCPYCGAKLSEGKGDAVLYKAESKYWLFYLHYDVPMRENGFQSPEDREKIRKVWG